MEHKQSWIRKRCKLNGEESIVDGVLCNAAVQTDVPTKCWPNVFGLAGDKLLCTYLSVGGADKRKKPVPTMSGAAAYHGPDLAGKKQPWIGFLRALQQSTVAAFSSAPIFSPAPLFGPLVVADFAPSWHSNTNSHSYAN
jgi:hypothetical protein